MNWSTYFEITGTASEGGEHIFDVNIKPDCDVYRGHFPGKPISPGVCNIGMIKCLAERIAGCRLHFRSIRQCRLTGMITPISTPKLRVVINMDDRNIHAEILDGVKSCMELKAEFCHD